MSNFVPNEFTCDDRDPAWMNPYIKYLIVAIYDFHKKFVLPSSNMESLFMFKNLHNQLIQSIHTAKQKYFNNNNNNNFNNILIINGKKVTCIPHDKFVTGFKEKSEIFNFFLANQHFLIPKNSILPSELKLLAEHILTSCDFSEIDILQIINN